MKATHIITIAFASLILGACATSQPALTSTKPTTQPTGTELSARCPSTTTRWKVPVIPRDARSGPDDALITMVVFNDFQCPYCARAKATVDQVRQLYGERIRVVFKHNPLAFHSNARSAAYAAMAAQQQGKFWEMHDLLFKEQSIWGRGEGTDAYAELARKIGLDVAQFKRTFDDANRRFRSWVDADQQAAHDVQAKGTPTFFINGEQLRGAQPLARFQEVIDRQLALAECTVASGVSASDLYPTLMKSASVWSPFEETAHSFRLEGRPSQGPEDAAFTVVEFTDFQCPYCGRMGERLKALQVLMPGRIRLVIKHFPLAFHKQALPAAKASIAAHRQGRFWDMHDALFAHQEKVREDATVALATTLNLDMKRFLKDIDDPTVVTLIDEDMADGRAAGLRGTPTLYINGRRYDRLTGSPEEMQRDIERYLRDKTP
jgi:protein-disulfide isomerase